MLLRNTAIELAGDGGFSHRGDWSVGALLIKPDAIEAEQVGFIRDIVKEKLAPVGGKIALELSMVDLSQEEVRIIYPTLQEEVLEDVERYLASGPCIGMLVDAPLSIGSLMRRVIGMKGPRLGDRSTERLLEGRITNGTIRDLLPLPGDEEMYQSIIPSLVRRRNNPTIRRADPRYAFTDEQYFYYSRNLAHSPDNREELDGLFDVIVKRTTS